MIKKLIDKKRFNKQALLFNETYKKLASLGDEPYVMPFWYMINNKVLDSFQPTPKWDFLSIQALRDTMFVDGSKVWLDTQWSYLKKIHGRLLSSVVKEDWVGSPKLIEIENNKTSHNSIHHQYHIDYFFEITNTKPKEIKTIIEWGGGYGNLAKLWKRNVNPDVTYIIIDTALFTSLQELYLSSVLGKNAVHVIDSSESKIIQGKINLIPLALMNRIDITGDLFISTWGLSESLDIAQDYVVHTENWFDCKHLLIGFQDSTTDLKHATRLGKLARESGAKIIDIEFIPHNHYALK